MAPNRIVTIRRWEVIAAFALVVASYALGLWIVTKQNNHIAAIDHRSTIASCARLNTTLDILHNILQRAAEASRQNPQTPEQAARAVKFYADSFSDIERARC